MNGFKFSDAFKPFGLSASPDSLGGSVSPLAILLISGGQSNDRKAGVDRIQPAEYASLADCYSWDNTVGAFAPYVCATNSGHRGQEDTGVWGSEAEFIRLFNISHPGVPIYVVKEAVDGNAINPAADQWYPPNGSRTEGLVVQVNAAKAALAGLSVENYTEVTLWNQGEADSQNNTEADAYFDNFGDLLTWWRAEISTGQFIIERIRPCTSDLAGTPYNAQFRVRYAQERHARESTGVDIIDLDFDPTNFASLHPGNSWCKGAGARCYHRWAGSYNANYPAIEDHDPSNLSFSDVTGAALSTVTTSAVVEIAGIGEGSAISIVDGEYRILNLDDTVWLDWTSSAGVIHPWQKLQLRLTSSASPETALSATVTVGSASDTWIVTTTDVVADYEAETDAFIATLATNGGGTMTSTQAEVLDDLVIALKGHGLLDGTKLKVLYLSAVHDYVANRINLIDQTTLSVDRALAGGAVPWTAYAGLNPGNTNGRSVNAQANPSALTAQNSAFMGIFTGTMTADTSYDITSTDNTFRFQAASAAVRAQVHSGTVQQVTGLTNTAGFYAVNRTASTTTTFYGVAGTSIGSSATASQAPSGTDFNIGCGSSGGVTADRDLKATFMGTGMTATDIQNLRNALNAFFTAFVP